MGPTPRSPIWHPFTQHLLEPPMTRIVKTAGAYLIDEDGRSILDAISSWWVITHGHRHPAIMNAIRTASETLDQIIFAEYSHEPADRLTVGFFVKARLYRFPVGSTERIGKCCRKHRLANARICASDDQA